MSERIGHLPGIYQKFREQYPAVAQAQDALAVEVNGLAPFDDRTLRLLKLALAIGAEADGAVRSHTRRGLSQGLSAEELRGVALLAVTTCGFPTSIAAMRWIEDVLTAESEGDDDASGDRA